MAKDYNENGNEELSLEEIVNRLKANIADEQSKDDGASLAYTDESSDGDIGMPDSEDTLRRFIKKYSVSSDTPDTSDLEVASDEAEVAEKAADDIVAEEKEEKEQIKAAPKRFRFTRTVKLGNASPVADVATEASTAPEKSDDAEESTVSEQAFEAETDNAVAQNFEIEDEVAEEAAEDVEEPSCDESNESGEIDENGDKRDIVLMRALGMELDDTDEELYEDEDDADAVPEVEFEYKSPSQNKEIASVLAKELKTSKIRLIAGAVIAFLLLLFEGLPAIGADLPGAFSLYNYPTVYALIDLQLFLLSAALVYIQLWAGARNLFEGFATAESVSFAVAVITFVSSVILNIAGATSESVFFCFPAALCMLITSAFEYMNLKRDLMSFDVACSNRPKHVVSVGNHKTDRREIDAVIEDADAKDVKVLKVSKTSFVSGFFERSHAGEKDNGVNIILISVALAAMLAVFIISAVKGGFVNGVTAANTVILFCLPATVFFANAYPLMTAAARASEDGCAIVGASAIDEYSDASLVVFEDKDVFPSDSVKVKSVKIYDNNRIDNILYWVTSVFSRANGPLTDVFLNATVELGHSKDVTLESVDDDGIDSIVDGSRILVGNEQFLCQYGIYPTYDTEDDALIRSGDAGILFVVRDGVICAKFYISYSIDPEFEDILKRLYGAGICAVIKTFDPNINDGLLGRAIKLSRYPVKIVRCTADETIDEENDKISSGIVTKSSVKSLLNTIVTCQNLKSVFRANSILKIAATAVSITIMLLLALFGKTVASPLIALYQAIWLIPTLAAMKLYLK